MINRIYDPQYAAACFFRSTVTPPDKKVMLQITERCNLRCAHCFAEANCLGSEMPIELIKSCIIPQFIKSKVTKVTLTGGEPLVHSHIKEIVETLLEKGIGVSICTNGVLVDIQWAERLTKFNNVHFNVSLDGLFMKSHGRFRGIASEEVLIRIKKNISALGALGLLNGILTTPNKYATINEYIELCKYARANGANYVLMNPLSPFGRGTRTQNLAYSDQEMIDLKKETLPLITDDFEIVYIRFPNNERKPIGKCPIGAIPYIFCNGEIAACPYTVFAANGSDAYSAEEFYIGNIFNGSDLNASVEAFRSGIVHELATDKEKCADCSCGCMAIKISNNQLLQSCDFSLCPISGE